MKRITLDSATHLSEAAEQLSGFAADLSSAIQEWEIAKEGGSEEQREDARMARDEIDTAIEEITEQLAALGFIKEKA